MICRICNSKTIEIFDLGSMPPANSLTDSLNQKNVSYPLVLDYCNECSNLQLRDCLDSNSLYKFYYYVTPKSIMLKNHYERITNFLLSKGYLNKQSKVLEIGSNIGDYLSYLKPFVGSILGIDPAKNIVDEANGNEIPTICDFFRESSSKRILIDRGKFNSIIARHCFAHNSSPHDLLKGVKNLLSTDGYVVIENAYAISTIEGGEFDQIYHEHMFYFSIKSMSTALEMNGLSLVDVIISLVHGGSIGFIATHKEKNHPISHSVNKYLVLEKKLLNEKNLLKFASNALNLKKEILNLINELVSDGKTIYSYGATAKGNTLLNFLGIKNNMIKYCVDSTKIKHNKYLPGSGIPIISEEFASSNPPDYYFLTAWNYREEIIEKIRINGNFNTLFIIPFPKLIII